MLVVILTKKERPVRDVKVRKSLDCRDREMVELGSLKGGSWARNGITALDFR